MRRDPRAERRTRSLPATDVPDPSTLPDPPPQRLSPLRVAVAVALLAVIAAGTTLGLRHAATSAADDRALGKSATWFAPYVDVTLTPTSAFQNRAANPAKDVVLGFVVAGKQDACTPSWGTYQSLDGAAEAQDLDRRVAQVRGQGGDAVVSFGGQANRELAVACTDQDALTAAYAKTLTRYSADTADFDIEGAALTDAAANARRAASIKALQDAARKKGEHLAVWLTLPVAPTGLTAEGLQVVRGLLQAKVDLAGVNVMAMDFGGDAHKDMLGAITSAATATHRQLGAIYGQQDASSLSDRQLWRKVGLTVMIGQNDVDEERVTVADARAITAFVRRTGAGRLSMWSLNRDAQCGVTFPVVGTHSNLCSGVAQRKLQFSSIFDRFEGGARQDAERVTPAAAQPQSTTATTDDPARSPYPIWTPREAYPERYKVVWHQAVYQAKWYTQGETPDAPNDPRNSAWTLVGPVLRSDRAPVIPKSKPGTHPKWSSRNVYTKGAKVLHKGLPYRAKWYTAGDVPGQLPEDGSPAPWAPLFTIPGEPQADAAG